MLLFSAACYVSIWLLQPLAEAEEHVNLMWLVCNGLCVLLV